MNPAKQNKLIGLALAAAGAAGLAAYKKPWQKEPKMSVGEDDAMKAPESKLPPVNGQQMKPKISDGEDDAMKAPESKLPPVKTDQKETDKKE